MKIFLVTLIVSISGLCKAQSFKEGSIWYLGSYTGFDFKYDPPKVLNDSKMYNLTSRTSTIADEFGNLLFYTNGDTVWNKHHKVMMNGIKLNLYPHNYGSNPASSCVIVPHPGDGELYYIFIASKFDPYTYSEFSYAIVDISADNGNGAVVQKNIELLDSSSALLTVTSHADEKSFWVTVHDGYENLYAYRISETGIELPVISHGPTYDLETFGASQMKVSPDGTKLVITNYPNTDFYIFNSMTGAISFLGRYAYNQGGQGVEFSPNSQFVYFATSNAVVQLEVNSDSIEEILNSEVTLGEYRQPFNGTGADFQLAYNGRIYSHLEPASRSPRFLACIQNPNRKGLACNYNGSSVLLPDGRGPDGDHGFINLPLSVQSIYRDLPTLLETKGCKGIPANIRVTSLGYADSLRWYFGDGTQKKYMFPSGKTVSHVYKQTGVYTVTVRSYIGNVSRELASNVTILEIPIVSLPIDTILCRGEGLILDAGLDGINYAWSTGETTQQIVVKDQNRYHVVVDNGGCTASDDVGVEIFEYPEVDLGSDRIICDSESLALAVPFNYDFNYQWDFGSTSSEITIKESGLYELKVSHGRCETDDQLHVQFAQIIFNLSETGIEVPFGTELSLEATGTNIDVWQWTFGDGLIDEATVPIIKHSYSMAGEYDGQIMVTNQYGCAADASFHVVVPEYLFVPNVITANSDSKNDLFEIQYNGEKQPNLVICDRWGKTVFSSQSFSNKWSAEGNDPGVYYYLLTLGKENYKGWIQVIK